MPILSISLNYRAYRQKESMIDQEKPVDNREHSPRRYALMKVMVDLGLFNFVKNAIAEGKSKDEIKIELAKGGWDETAMEAAFTAVESNTPPRAMSTRKTTPEPTIIVPEAEIPVEHRPALITALCGYYFISFLLSVISVSILSLSGKLPFSVDSTNVPSISIALISFLSVYGYWTMRRWGVMLFTLNTVALMLYLSTQLQGSAYFPFVATLIQSLLLPFVVVYIGFTYFEEMT